MFLVTIKNAIKASFDDNYKAHRFVVCNLPPGRVVELGDFKVEPINHKLNGVPHEPYFRDDGRLSIRPLHNLYVLYLQTPVGISKEILNRTSNDYVHRTDLTRLLPSTLRDTNHEGDRYQTVKFSSFLSAEDCHQQSEEYMQTFKELLSC